MNQPESCPECGSPTSGWLEGNCPTCLLRLGAPALLGKSPLDDPAASLRTGILHMLGDYELLEEIARGGMGVVYRARQVSLNRLVAVKVMQAAPSVGDLRRFRREAEVAASLTHPNIIPIYEVGEENGQAFFSMELVEGSTLAELCRDKLLPARCAAEFTCAVAEAVQFAHERHLLHRDLKPSNVLVDAYDTPRVTDFGLARRVDGDADLTLAGQVLGTPNYMPPEQAEAKGGSGSVAGDVYSLGAILYHLLTGRPPFLAEFIPQTLRLVVESEPVPASRLNPNVPRDLETICLKCLEKNPLRRYASARELADELGRSLRDEPIHARPLSAPARMLRWCRRKPALASAPGAGGLLLLGIVVGAPIALLRIEAERLSAESARSQEAAQRVRAEAAERATEQQLHAALLEQARATVRSGTMGHQVRALDALRRAGAITNTPELRREVLAALALPDLSFERTLTFARRNMQPQLNPAFERVALSTGPGAIAEGRLLATLPPSTNLPVYVKEWSADGRFLAVKRDYPDGGLRADWEVWDVAEARRVLFLQDVVLNAFDFHPRLPQIIADGRTNGVVIWNLEDGRELKRFPQVPRSRYLRFSPDGERFASASSQAAGTVISVYDAALPEAYRLTESSLIPKLVARFAWHPDGRWLAVPDHGSAVQWMDAHTGETGLIGQHKFAASHACFSPNGAWLFTGGYENQLICWDARTKRRSFDISMDEAIIQISADGRRCAVPTANGVQLLMLEAPAAHCEFFEDLGGVVRQAAFSPDGRWLAASGDRRPVVWDLEAGGPGVMGSNGSNVRLYFTPDSRELLATRIADHAPTSFRWRVSPATHPTQPPVITRMPLPQPQGFVSLALRSNVLVINATNGSQVLAPPDVAADSSRWTPTESGISGLSPDGRWLGIYRSYGTSLYVYRIPGLERSARLPHPVSIGDFQFSPVGDEVMIASPRQGGRVEFWSLTDWRLTRSLTNFDRVLYTPNARALWLSREQNSAGLYDAHTLEPLLLLPTGTVPIAVSPDGRHVAVTVDARRVQLWDLAEVRRRMHELGLDWADTR